VDGKAVDLFPSGRLTMFHYLELFSVASTLSKALKTLPGEAAFLHAL
jgi:hypothetical protein